MNSKHIQILSIDFRSKTLLVMYGVFVSGIIAGVLLVFSGCQNADHDFEEKLLPTLYHESELGDISILKNGEEIAPRLWLFLTDGQQPIVEKRLLENAGIEWSAAVELAFENQKSEIFMSYTGLVLDFGSVFFTDASSNPTCALIASGQLDLEKFPSEINAEYISFPFVVYDGILIFASNSSDQIVEGLVKIINSTSGIPVEDVDIYLRETDGIKLFHQ